MASLQVELDKLSNDPMIQDLSCSCAGCMLMQHWSTTYHAHESWRQNNVESVPITLNERLTTWEMLVIFLLAHG
eukprot:3166428-Amphidinium_carterae.1